MAWGSLVRWHGDRAFGFARVDYPRQEDVFIHASVLQRAGIEPIVRTHLEFETEMHKGQPRVKHCKKLRTWEDPVEIAPDQPVKLTGCIAHINAEKRFAFVARDDTPGVRVFNDLGRNGVPAVVGTRVFFDIGERGGRPCVVSIRQVDDGDDD